MAETVQDVFDELLGQYKAGLMLTVPHSPRASEEAELIPAVLSYYRQHFEAARDAEKGSKSTPLTDEQETCIECHDEQTGHPLTKGEFKYQHQLLDTANFCQWCGRKLGHANE